MEHDSLDSQDVIKMLRNAYKHVPDPRYRLMIVFMLWSEPFCCRMDGVAAWFRKRISRFRSRRLL